MERIPQQPFVIILSEYRIGVRRLGIILKRGAATTKTYSVPIRQERLSKQRLLRLNRISNVRTNVFATALYLIAQGLHGVVTVIPSPLLGYIKACRMRLLYLRVQQLYQCSKLIIHQLISATLTGCLNRAANVIA
jgi:hypothetical protein